MDSGFQGRAVLNKINNSDHPSRSLRSNKCICNAVNNDNDCKSVTTIIDENPKP